MIYYMGGVPCSDELYHFGINGMKWGIRRYQNADGTLTEAGKQRYYRDLNKMAKKDAQRVSDAKASYGEGAGTRRKLLSKEINEKKKNPDYEKAFEEASKHVDVAKSLKRAESLHKHSGTFVKGQTLAYRGYSHTKNGLNTAKNLAITALTFGSAAAATRRGDRVLRNTIFAIGGISAAGIVGKSIGDAHAYNYYERKKKL